jgi:hypothetical protein
MIVYGQLLAADEIVRRVAVVRDARSPVGWRVEHSAAIEPLELRAIATPCPITDHHGGPVIGAVRYVELGASGDTWIVGDLDAPMPGPGNARGELFLSVETKGPHDGATLLAAAITATPGMMLRPVAVLAERSLDELPERTTLAMRRAQPHGAALLERARDARRRLPTNVVDLRPQHDEGAWSRADLERFERSPGQLWHGQPGRVLAVR